MPNKQLHYTAEEIDELLGVVDNLDEATTSEAGLMSAEDKAKLDSVEDGAEANVIEGVQVGGTALTPANKVVNIPADSAPTSESTNLVRSGGVYTAIQTVANAFLNYYTKAEVDALLAGVHQFTYQVVAELPTASADTMYILYFVPSSDPQTQNIKDEYITIRSGSEGAYTYSWEKIGSTDIDLSDYPTTEEMNAAIATAVASKADKDDDAVEGNLAKFDANGNPVDAGIAAEKVAKKGEVQTFAGNLVDTRSAGTRQGPFAFRQSGGDGVNYMRKILGRTEAWNQLGFISPTDVSLTANGVTVTDNRDGSYSVSTDPGGATGLAGITPFSIPVPAGHLVLMKGCPAGGNYASGFSLVDNNTGAYDGGSGVVLTVAGAGAITMRIRVAQGTIITTPVVFRPQYIDLTLEGLGLTTADQFHALHPLLYYNYNAGVLKNNAATGLETTGFNQWDEEWESGRINGITGEDVADATAIRSKNFIPVLEGQTYYYKKATSAANLYVLYYAADGSYVTYAVANNTTKVIPAGVAKMRFYVDTTTTYANDICVNISDASRNGTYEPYWKREIVLGLDNLACHDENNNAVTVNGLDGVGTSQDELIVENGYVTKIIKRFAEVDLGGNSYYWVADTGAGREGVFYTQDITDIKAAAASNKTNMICSNYVTDSVTVVDAAGHNMTIGAKTLGDNRIQLFIQNNALDGLSSVQVNAALAGVKLRYEVATPKVLTLDNPIPALIEVDNLGTEKRLPEDTADNPQAPFECDSNYSISVANLVRKLNS